MLARSRRESVVAVVRPWHSRTFVRTRTTIHDLLEEARGTLARLTPEEARRASEQGAILVDTRSDDQRREQGVIPGARCVALSVLEWELDPASGHAELCVGLDAWIVLICAEGYSSSLAAARLQRLGFARATDVIGGVSGWKAAGLPLLAA
jgi:rhodanese-related sulfurtransferase